MKKVYMTWVQRLRLDMGERWDAQRTLWFHEADYYCGA